MSRATALKGTDPPVRLVTTLPLSVMVTAQGMAQAEGVTLATWARSVVTSHLERVAKAEARKNASKSVSKSTSKRSS